MYQRHRKDACERCGGSPDHVHHRDRDRGNGDPANLETLCGSCHSAEHRGSWHVDRRLFVDEAKRERVEVRCSSEQLASWKAAAGAVPLGRWMRRVLDNEVAGRPVPSEYERRSLREAAARAAKAVVDEPVVVTTPRASAARPFRPDFGSRLKEGKK